MVSEQKRQVLVVVKPLLAELIGLLDALAQAETQDECNQFAEEFSKPISEVCGGFPSDFTLWYSGGQYTCFECVFRHYGLELKDFGSILQGDRARQVERLRSLLQAYTVIDTRLLAILQGGCDDVTANLSNVASLLDVILGPGQLQLRYMADNPQIAQFGKTHGTSEIELPEDQFESAENRNPAFDYQTIGFLLTHEIGHAFYNRLDQVIYDEQGGTVTIEYADKQERQITLPPNTPGAVVKYFEAIGGYYNGTGQRDFNYPREYDTSAQKLTSLDFYGPEQPLDTYNADGRTIRPDLKSQYEAQRLMIYTVNVDNVDKEFVYVDRTGNPVNEADAARFFAPNVYIPNLTGVQRQLEALGDTIPGVQEFFPNERRDTADLTEGFADSFAAYILRPDILKNTTRGDFFDANMQTWLCQLLRESLK